MLSKLCNIRFRYRLDIHFGCDKRHTCSLTAYTHQELSLFATLLSSCQSTLTILLHPNKERTECTDVTSTGLIHFHIYSLSKMVQISLPLSADPTFATPTISRANSFAVGSHSLSALTHSTPPVRSFEHSLLTLAHLYHVMTRTVGPPSSRFQSLSASPY